MIDLLFSTLFGLVSVLTFTQWLSVFMVITFCYIYNFYDNNLWKRLKVHYLTPLPMVGNDLPVVLGQKTVQDHVVDKYNRLGDRAYGGTFQMTQPIFLVKDPQLVEAMLITDFSHFMDRGLVTDEKRQPLSAHLFNLSGKRWKNLRNKLSPVFTSGKLKTMHHQLIECTDNLIDILEINAESKKALDIKETMAKFTTDVIGSCAYGLNINSQREPDNEFRRMGRKVFETSALRKIKTVLFFICLAIYPKLAFILRLRSLPKEVEKFFIDLVPATVKAREQNSGYVRNDFIQLLMNLKSQNGNNNGTDQYLKNKDDKSTDEVYVDDNMMAANSFIFFIAGFETTASTLTYCLFELAHHQEIQKKVYEEVTQVLSKFEGQPSYDALKNLHYMDMVISETLRKYPPVPILLRVCTENYKVPGADLILPKGCRVDIPVYALHHDPNIYPDPEAFIPDRFSPENKDSVPKGAYLPFGDGPRICIGARFAQMEVKVCLSKILSKFKVLKTPGMSDVLTFDPKSSLILMPKGEINLIVEPR